MKIKMISMAMTPNGIFEKDMILTDARYPVAFLNHLVNDCNAAEVIDYETKIDDKYEVKKNPQSLPLSQPDKVSQKKTRGRPKKTAPSLQSTTLGD